MNAPLGRDPLHLPAVQLREIPYNYTSFSDREITLRYLGEVGWKLIQSLRGERRTGQSARMLFEVLGDIWVIDRNPFIQEDLLGNRKRRDALVGALRHRIGQIVERASSDTRVDTLISLANATIEDFQARLRDMQSLRKTVQQSMRNATHADNVRFDGLSRVSHVTDATDWRVELPFVVLTPDSEAELPEIVKRCITLGLTIVPRGGGTGYTGGAIPLHANTAVINLEKLDARAPIQVTTLPASDLFPERQVSTIKVESGVVTRRVSEAASAAGLAFAVDPTSQDASTIGGNVAMNAGGKKAVIWGTTLDNLLSWRMVDPNGHWLDIERLDHNLGKIHLQEAVRFEVTRRDAISGDVIGQPWIINMAGSSLRKQGLGKDVTDKFLGGLPGVQKEGCDGLITSAVFILHRMPAHIRTVCMEFYGQDLRQAVLGITEVKDFIDNTPGIELAGLEHLDDRYIKAVKYSAKAARGKLPKMLLIADIVSDDPDLVGKVASGIVLLVNNRGAEGFIAVSADARKQFWAARSRTAAIAAHTNAFKINEDVVIPLSRLADYSEGIERINIEHALSNKLRMLAEVRHLLSTGDAPALVTTPGDDSDESKTIIVDGLSAAVKMLDEIYQGWSDLYERLQNSDEKFLDALRASRDPIEPHPAGPHPAGCGPAESDPDVLALLRRDDAISYRDSVERPLKERFSGHRYARLRKSIDDIHAKWRPQRLFTALHMHAGDGNIHTNIPVNSSDYTMLRQAEGIVERVMELARLLNGVISGEHGIGLTKIKYLDDSVIQAFADYKNQIDPNGHFNKDKLMPGSGLDNAYTPSLQLVQQEALILEQSELGALNDSIKDCLRCGKCKPVCATHSPGANLLYSPRNKVLGTGLIIEAFLYEEQTRRGLSIRHFDEMNDIADHCTVCHKCLAPCPVDIDFGEVSIMMRKILGDRGQKNFSLGTKMSMAFLNAKDPTTIKVLRKGMVQWGFQAQRTASDFVARLPTVAKSKREPPSTTGRTRPIEQVVHFVNRKLPGKAMLPAKTTRALLGIENKEYVPIIRDPAKVTEDSEAVFYFPGCGSERLFSQVGLATLAMLYDSGSKTVLPPGYLCCGYPQTSSGDVDKGKQISTENRVLFHRVANTLNYLDIKTVIVSCGTCMDQLQKYEFEKIFPGCRLLDIHEYLMEKKYSLDGVTGEHYVYHDPCHSPMKTYQPLQVTEALLGKSVTASDRCCGEAGTFAVARPDIATQVRERKARELAANLADNNVGPGDKSHNVKMMTSCPACVQGLSRFKDETGMDTDYIVVELAKGLFGDNWANDFVDRANEGGVEQVLL
ncbi:MAG: FAD/FMN-containing dehydrogenase/Fe-S oxidoreductase [Granulosicoccus sp.]|jgi:FAD/FMN-containing dehydrogenase/Fe-S oxidoreductase